MTKSSRARCPKCGYSGANHSVSICPKCGADMRKKSLPGLPGGGIFWIPALLLLMVVGGVIYLFFTNAGVASELRQIRQPLPNRFLVGVDVSATISTDSLDKFKDALIGRLRFFIGDEEVSYEVLTFGNPGCGSRSFRNAVSTSSPEDEVTFTWKVEEKIREISPAKVSMTSIAPLTTPINLFLKTWLPNHKGGRVIIFSDLLNDEPDCASHLFPEDALDEFGTDKNGQLIFLYPSVHEDREKQQDEFIRRVQTLNSEGRVRAYFFRIPDTSSARRDFMDSQLRNAVPATTFDLVWERTTKVFYTIVSAVRG